MRSFYAVSRFALLAILLAGSAYGSSTPATQLYRNAGEYFEAALITLLDDVIKCHLDTPKSETIEFKPVDHSDDKHQLLEDEEFVHCRVLIRNLDENDNGIWTLYSESAAGTTRSQSYNLTVNVTTEATTTTEFPEDKTVEYLTAQNFDSKMGETHTVTIPDYDFITSEVCLIITPDGLQVHLDKASISGLEDITVPNAACGVKITVESEELVGRWFLISRGARFTTEHIERRLPFTISVEETEYAMPSSVSVAEGNEFHVRLNNPISNPESCKLLGPYGQKYEEYEADTRYVDTCGYIIKDVRAFHNGTWQIVYGNRIIHRAHIQVTVTSNDVIAQQQTFTWTRDQPVQEVFGPETAIYCKVVDPREFVIFEGFGRCNVTLTRATGEHDGVWTMFVGLNGRVLTEESTFTVSIIDGAPKATVRTSVAQNKPLVMLSCAISSPYPISTCKFRTPSGRILMANPGVGEDRYTFHGQGSSYESGVHTHDCGIQITNPEVRDLGLWRCAVETTHETYYGFVSVICPWAMRDPEVAAAVVTEPTLTADREMVTALEGDSVLMSCNIQTVIRYCYFRTRNGTIFSVGPGGSSTDMASYAGAGLDSGECAIRFRSLRATDTGPWSCHVGLTDTSLPEQRATFSVSVQDPMVASQEIQGHHQIVKLEVQGRQLEYCRFVRMDGLGFTEDTIPEQYVGNINLNAGECSIWILHPTILDRHPWTVAAKIRGQGVEISRTTRHQLQIPAPEAPDGPDDPDTPIMIIYRIPVYWIVIMFLGLTLIMMGSIFGHAKNRRWAREKASSLRNSFRHSFNKKAVNEQNVNQKNTANAA